MSGFIPGRPGQLYGPGGGAPSDQVYGPVPLGPGDPGDSPPLAPPASAENPVSVAAEVALKLAARGLEIVEQEGGHIWVKDKRPSPLIKGLAFCWRCGYVRRADKKSKPCRGATRITTRGGEGEA